MAGTKNNASMPKDLQAMSNILKDFGITDHEPGVENHMLDFTNRYVTTLVEDALLYSTHANKKCIDIDDVKLAIELQQDKIYTCPPSREVGALLQKTATFTFILHQMKIDMTGKITATMARQRNTLPLPTIRSSAGLRLPPDRHSLIACNYHLKSAAKKPRTVHTISRVNVSNMPPTTPIAPRPTFNVQKTITPLMKFSEANKGTTPTTALSPMSSTATVSSANSSVTSQILMPTVGILNEVKLSNDGNINKRPHEDLDDYDN